MKLGNYQVLCYTNNFSIQQRENIRLTNERALGVKYGTFTKIAQIWKKTKNQVP